MAATKQSTTVRISEQTHHRLREMAAQSGEPMQAVLDKALEQYRRQKFWEEMDTAYTAIQSDPEALKAEKKEFALWEATLMDGLDPDEDWSQEAAASLSEKKVPNILYGDIWYGGLDPTVGHEQAGQRPMLVVSPPGFSNGPLPLVLVLPVTTNLRPLPSRVPLLPPEGGVTRPSIILCEGIRSISHERLQRRMGTAGAETMQEVQDRLRILMNL